MSTMNCVTCDKPFFYRWTDTHGVGVCVECGTPYTIYHYKPDSNERLDLPPVPALKQSGLELAKRYWKERGRKVFPACYDFMGVSRRRGDTTYSGATDGDIRAFALWYRKNVSKRAGDDLDDAIEANGGGFTI